MKRFLAPVLLLAGLLLFSIWNSLYFSRETARWSVQLDTAEVLSLSNRWEAAAAVLDASYQDWAKHQTWLHIATRHDAIDDAEAMYHRAAAFARTQEPSEFQAELADLQAQLRLLAEMERLDIKNIL